MRLTAPLYEGDSLIRSGPVFGADEVPATAESAAAVVPEPVEPKADGVFELHAVPVTGGTAAVWQSALGHTASIAWC